MEIKEGRISNTALQNLCIKHNWFTSGDCDQYKALFDMNDMAAPIGQIATVIWICSDMDKWCRRDIIMELHEAGFTARESRSEKEHLEHCLGI